MVTVLVYNFIKWVRCTITFKKLSICTSVLTYQKLLFLLMKINIPTNSNRHYFLPPSDNLGPN